MKKTDAILLVGPTGSGKTPLGELLQQQGLGGQACSHFDFGDQLRRATSAELPPPGLNGKDVAFITSVLRSGALLEDEHFYIAEIILRDFIIDNLSSDDGLIVLNGLPRHVGQANDIDDIIAVKTVIHLFCTAEIVFERIAANSGGARTGRADDARAAISNKLEIFTRRIEPLIEHYRNCGAKIVTLQVETQTTPQQMQDQLNAAL